MPPSPPQDKTRNPFHIFREWPGGHQASPVLSPLLRTMLPFLHQFRRPSGPPRSSPFWNHELLPAFNIPAPDEPQTLFLGRTHRQVPLLQTEVTVLTLAERACLNLLFRSCMLGDLGLGMREVLRFSGVLLGGCLWLTSLHRTWKAL